jgi:hypothetical protein
MPKKGVVKAAEVLHAEKCKEIDDDEEESAGWVETVQGENKPYDVLMKMKSIKTSHCYCEEHGWIPVLQTISLLGCPTCFKAVKIPRCKTILMHVLLSVDMILN